MMEKSALNIFKKTILAIFFIVIVIIFAFLLIETRDTKLIKDIKNFKKSDMTVLYITNKENYSKKPIELFDKYEVNYQYIDSTNLSRVEKSKIRKIINSSYLTNIIVVFKNGKVKDAIIDYSNYNDLIAFLQKNEIVPSIIADTTGIVSSVEESINTDLTLLYLPYNNSDEVEYQDNILKNIANQYNIKYKKVDIYLLSNFQKQHVNTILGVSEVEDQLVVLIRNNKIVTNIRGVHRRSTFVNELYKSKIIIEVLDNLNKINYNDYEQMLKSDDRSIILITKNDCKYCESLAEILGNIAIEHTLDINYLNIETIESEISLKVQNSLKAMGMIDGFSTPIMLIIEKGRIVDYIIGGSTENYILEIFKEYGIIKTEV